MRARWSKMMSKLPYQLPLDVGPLAVGRERRRAARHLRDDGGGVVMAVLPGLGTDGRGQPAGEAGWCHGG